MPHNTVAHATGTHTTVEPIFWIAFTAVIVALLALDLGVFNRKAHTMRSKEALAWYGVWVALAIAFNIGIAYWLGSKKGLEFLTGYLIEQALSVDNIFVFLVIFQYFAVPAALQRSVLFWGILGAIVMRVTFILAGAALLNAFHWTIYVMGAFLVLTGFKLLRHDSANVQPERNPVVRAVRRLFPVISEYRGSSFFTRENGRLHATLLLLVLVAVEATDVAFAIDSIPAIFAVTQDPFIVYTSNIFAILGLRSLFFLLAGFMGRFHYLQVGLALVLMFVGGKMLVSGVYHVPIGLSLCAVALLIGGSVVVSLLRPPKPEGPLAATEDGTGVEPPLDESLDPHATEERSARR
jgi:tellurite resistance protein TerC